MSTKKEMILAYLESDSIARQAARLAMYSAEVAFKAAAQDYTQSSINIEDHLLDLGEVMGLDQDYNDGTIPAQGYDG